MKLCIPTLCRYDRLRDLLASAEAEDPGPSEYVILDNGGALLYGEKLSTRRRVTILTPPRNLGVAPSWNRFLDLNEPIIIANDDTVFTSGAWRTLTDALARVPFVEGHGFALFGVTPACVAAIGHFDENFAPAYYEDCDYDLRLRNAGVERVTFPWGALATHHTSSTAGTLPSAEIESVKARNRAYFAEKWGGQTPHPPWYSQNDHPLFAQPFDGQPPPGWQLRPFSRVPLTYFVTH